MALSVLEAGTAVPVAGRRRLMSWPAPRLVCWRHHQHAFLLVPAAQLAPPRHEHRPDHELLRDLQSKGAILAPKTRLLIRTAPKYARATVGGMG